MTETFAVHSFCIKEISPFLGEPSFSAPRLMLGYDLGNTGISEQAEGNTEHLLIYLSQDFS